MAHRTVVRVTAALVASVAIEVVALNAWITDDILWPPTTLPRGLMLVALPVMQVVERIGPPQAITGVVSWAVPCARA
jgi:hypothetical protein